MTPELVVRVVCSSENPLGALGIREERREAFDLAPRPCHHRLQIDDELLINRCLRLGRRREPLRRLRKESGASRGACTCQPPSIRRVPSGAFSGNINGAGLTSRCPRGAGTMIGWVVAASWCRVVFTCPPQLTLLAMGGNVSCKRRKVAVMLDVPSLLRPLLGADRPQRWAV
jgi:hypothetical protein